MRPAVDDLEIMGDHDPVEHRDRPPGMKASAAGREVMMGPEIAKTAAADAPFVEIAHEDRRRISLTLVEMTENGMGLAPAPQPRQIQMHSNDPKEQPVHLDIGEHCSARLERRKVKKMTFEDLDGFSNQQGIAMPADASDARIEGNVAIFAMLLQ